MIRFKKSFAMHICLLFAGLVIALIITEIGLRILRPNTFFGAGRELPWCRQGGERIRGIFTTDPELGFRPIVGIRRRDEYGIKTHNYRLDKRPGIARLLFVGDSVTNRGKIIQAFKDLYGDTLYEYWNAGVSGYNTEQELLFYKRYNQNVNPDHVILTFHLNDFEATPVAFINGNDRLVVYSPDRNLRYISKFLFRNSYLYRFFLGLSSRNTRKGIEIRRRELTTCLKEFRDILGRDDIEFTVLVLPWLTHHELWKPITILRRIMIIEVLNELEISHFDLLPCLDYALEEGIDVQESVDDRQHPSEAFSRIIVEYLSKQGFLSGTSTPDSRLLD